MLRHKNKVACAFPIAAKSYGYDTNNGSNVAIVWRKCFCPVLFVLSPGFYRQGSLTIVAENDLYLRSFH